MPHYDYTCTKCGNKEEHFQKISDDPLVECSNCHQPFLKRGPGGGVGLQFKGSGFYITDYNDSSSSSSSPKEKKSSSGGSCGCGKTSCDK